MKIEEAYKRLSHITLVGEEYDAARRSLMLWQDFKREMEEVKKQGHFVLVDVNYVIECINECTREIEGEG